MTITASNISEFISKNSTINLSKCINAGNSSTEATSTNKCTFQILYDNDSYGFDFGGFLLNLFKDTKVIIPQGPQGDTGSQGPQGPQGPAGQSADVSAINSAFEALNTAVNDITSYLDDLSGTTTLSVLFKSSGTLPDQLSYTPL